jgi:hypothetical protein
LCNARLIRIVASVERNNVKDKLSFNVEDNHSQCDQLLSNIHGEFMKGQQTIKTRRKHKIKQNRNKLFKKFMLLKKIKKMKKI